MEIFQKCETRITIENADLITYYLIDDLASLTYRNSMVYGVWTICVRLVLYIEPTGNSEKPNLWLFQYVTKMMNI